jgi:hypothetical protein
MDNGFHAFCALEWKLADPFWNPECTALALLCCTILARQGKCGMGMGKRRSSLQVGWPRHRTRLDLVT